MKRITYASGTVITGDAIAAAIADYARALARRNNADVVSFPALVDDQVDTVEILIGPASQLLVIPDHRAHDEIVDVKLVDELRRKTDALAITRPEADEASSFESFDYD